MKEFMKKNKLLLWIIVIILLIAVIIYFLVSGSTQNGKIQEVHQKNYFLQYDTTWKIEKKEELEVKLLHKNSASELTIKIHELENEMQYETLDEILDSLLYNIEKQNKNYNLLYKGKAQITRKHFDGYKLLFESNQNQAAIYFYKQGSKIVTFLYEAPYEHFDRLLDSVNTIIYNFSIKEKIYDIITKIDLDTQKIVYTKQEELVNILKENQQEEISFKNYTIKYSIPNNFEMVHKDTEATYNFENLPMGTKLSCKVSILNHNLYEYLNRENASNLYDKYSLGLYKKVEEALEKRSDELPLSYIYRNRYELYDTLYENVEMIFELNKNHIVRMVINSEGIGIPEEIVKKINLEGILKN